ncbi:MAG: hypothetical protein ACXWKP_10255 [Bradyrhizobium sp.]
MTAFQAQYKIAGSVVRLLIAAGDCGGAAACDEMSVADEARLYFNDELSLQTLGVFDSKGLAMKCSKRSFAVVSILFAALLTLNAGIPGARDADLVPLTFAAAQTAKQQCTNTCRARYRDCLSKKQIPSFECRNVYQDCTRFTCSAVQG